MTFVNEFLAFIYFFVVLFHSVIIDITFKTEIKTIIAW